MKHIASRDNPQFKQLQRLAQHAGRRGENAILEGVHLCQAWLASSTTPALAVFDADRLDRPELSALLAAVQAVLPERQILALTPQLLKHLETVETGQGVLFIVDPPSPTLPVRLDESMVWLDRVQDPGNVGTILRICAAAGVSRVLLSPGCAAAWSPKVLRGGQGAHFALSIHEQVDLMACVDRLDVPLAVTTLENAQELYATALPKACAWVFGHEGQGVSSDLQSVATLRVRIDHAPLVESLNVGVATALCLFEQRRQGTAPRGRS
ncbi:TrmH family RNA methyltransferase [Bordetella genomosp. 4]|uniref:RNA methyltransferase n=1 Tax=Bordetella genomosp. 4 TaxID=463044 RepID=A0A261U5M8_9BORD|nr:RNA methyltransferase [Bordetella genomosp. 4]OZI49722.1 RNA methyltransferase [Bordetella genomosp. 4]OZI56163.1 RNA methyltransferase [Bordetella genomosp. 4]